MDDIKKINKELILKILFLIVLIILIGITSFRSGNKFYLLKNMYLNGKTDATAESNVSRWSFSAKIINRNQTKEIDSTEGE